MRVLFLVLVALAALPVAHGQDVAAVSSRFECPGCLVPVSPDAARCPECGVSFKKLEYECPKCKNAVAFDAARCANCGLVFDPPKPGEKEKRSAKERDMPAVRDFLKNPKADDKGLEIHGASLTLWRMGREKSFDGTTTIMRVIEDANVNVLHLGIPELSFHASGLFVSDPNNRPEARQKFTLREAYLRYETEDEKTQIQLGRQFIDSGVTREFVDAVFLHHLFGDRLGVEVFGGHPVATETPDAGGDIMAGTRIYWRGLPKVVSRVFRDLTIGVSAKEELWDGRIVRLDFGVDFSFSPTWEIDISGHAYYSFVYKEWYDARGTFQWRPLPLVQLTVDYRYLEPHLLLPASSMFSVFADDRRHELEVALDFFVLERLKLSGFGRAYYIANESYRTSITLTKIDLGTEIPYELGARFSLKHGSTLKGEFGGQVGILVKGGIERYEGATVRSASVLQARLYEMLSYDVADKHTIKGSADIHFEAYDGQIYKRRNTSATVTVTGGYMYDRSYGITIGGDYRTTPDFGGTYDAFAKLEIYF